jgi:FkbM family methyltransferase
VSQRYRTPPQWLAPATALRVASSMIRRRMRGWQQPIVRYDDGRSRIVADLRTALGLGLYRYGFHAPEIELVRLLLKPGDTFVDGGANVGLFSLVAAAAVGPTGHVVCFEPASATRASLCRNVEINRFSWVEVRAEALGEAEATGTLLTFDGDGAGLSSFAPANSAGARDEEVRITTLDRFFSRHAATIRLVKLDLEGAEVRALRGASELLASGPDLIVELEPSHLRRQGDSAEELVRLLEAAGYQIYEIGLSGIERVVSSSDPTVSATNVFATRDPGVATSMRTAS